MRNRIIRHWKNVFKGLMSTKVEDFANLVCNMPCHRLYRHIKKIKLLFNNLFLFITKNFINTRKMWTL